jgi:hypothetical protein
MAVLFREPGQAPIEQDGATVGDSVRPHVSHRASDDLGADHRHAYIPGEVHVDARSWQKPVTRLEQCPGRRNVHDGSVDPWAYSGRRDPVLGD